MAIAQATAEPPKAVVSDLIYDFGRVVRADSAEKSFKIKNEGGSTLKIREVQTTCACTVVDFPRSLEAGESGEIKVAIDTDFVDGAFQAQATLFTNDPMNPKIDLTFKIETQPYLYAQPGYIRYNVYQHFPETADAVARQLVWAEKPTEFKITKVESPYDFIEVTHFELPPAERDPKHDGTQWAVETKIRSDAPVGPIAGYVRVYTDHEKQGMVSIPISGFVRPLFAVSPADLDLGEFEIKGEPINTALHVTHFQKEPTLEITSVESDVEGFEISVEPIEAGRAYWVRLTVQPDMPKGSFSGTVKIHTNSKDEPLIVTPIRGKVK